MLRPVDLDTVFAHDRVHGVDHGHRDTGDCEQVHAGLAWWLGACLVLTADARAVVLVHDDSDLARAYAYAFAQGAVNCDAHAAVVSVVAPGGWGDLACAVRALGAPGALVTAEGKRVSVRLVDRHAAPFILDDGLGRIRDLIAADRVPRPVDTAYKGCVEQRPDLLTASHREGYL